MSARCFRMSELLLEGTAKFWSDSEVRAEMPGTSWGFSHLTARRSSSGCSRSQKECQPPHLPIRAPQESSQREPPKRAQEIQEKGCLQQADGFRKDRQERVKNGSVRLVGSDSSAPGCRCPCSARDDQAAAFCETPRRSSKPWRMACFLKACLKGVPCNSSDLGVSCSQRQKQDTRRGPCAGADVAEALWDAAGARTSACCVYHS